MTKADPQTPTRERLIGAMLDALRTRGFHGIGLSELLTQAGAPKGVLYHHFPGGKTELAIAAIESAIAGMLASLDRLLAAHVDPADALEAWMSGAQKLLLASGFERGCPLATVALESTPEDLALRATLSAGFAAIRERLSGALQQHGMSDAAAHQSAMLIVAAYEGALLQARVAGNVNAMADTCAALVSMIRPQLRYRP
ncbi:MAG: TetR/AcrR family transcriptional regulator [Xanthomonadales bacterium]|nr:TetR/AcrR family transcriptional regulator [Xanthomonadales bacterium]